MEKITSTRILELLREGWELGASSGLDTSSCFHASFWMQRELMFGGDTFYCNGNSFSSLLKRGAIVLAPKRKGDPYWLMRYKLKTMRSGLFLSEET